MSLLSDTGAVIGAIGITTLANGVLWSRRFTVAHRYFRMHRKEPLDVILVTSGLEPGGVTGLTYRRPVTSFGTLQGAAMFAKTLGDLKAGKTLAVSVSEQLTEEPLSDVALLGDPTKNPVAQRFLEDFNAVFPEHRITRDAVGEGARLLRVGDYELRFELTFQETSDNPLTDVGIIVAWHNPFTPEKRRGVFCAGFTGWGTAAASLYYLNTIPRHRYRRLRQDRTLPRLLSPTWPCFVAVVEVCLSGEKFIGINELCFRPLPDRFPADALRGQPRAERAAPAVEPGTVVPGPVGSPALVPAEDVTPTRDAG